MNRKGLRIILSITAAALLLVLFRGGIAAQGGDPITVDGLLDSSYTFSKHFDNTGSGSCGGGDDDAISGLSGNKNRVFGSSETGASPGEPLDDDGGGGDCKNQLAPGNLYAYEGTNTCYWAFVVDRAFNDNVYADKGTDDAYLIQDGWVKSNGQVRDHDFKKLERSDGAQFVITGTNGVTSTVWLDYLNKEKSGQQYLSGTASGEKDDTFGSGWQSPPIDSAATSLYWNLGNSGWNGGSWSDPLKHSPPFNWNDTPGQYWEWHMIYEFAIPKSDLLNGSCDNLDQGGAHNSPAKDDASLGKIGDYVWNDANQNGVQDDGGESAGIANVTVNLYDNTDTLIRTTQTAPSGYYIFNNLDAGQYYVEFVKPAGYSFTDQDQGIDDNLDSDADTGTGKTIVITLASGQSDLTWDAGLYLTNTDFGDLPESGLTNYAMTTFANNGARHTIGSLMLGSSVDAEADGQPDNDAGGPQPSPPKTPAGGDDGDGSDDEDGVVRTSSFLWTPTNGGSVDVTVSGGNGCLSAWIDWGNDGSFTAAGDLVIDNQPVPPGMSNFTFPFGSDHFGQSFFARFRLYPRDGNGTCDGVTASVTGEASGGEVEDYFWEFAPNAVTLTALAAKSSSGFPAGPAAAALAFLAGGVAIGGVLMRRRRER